MPDEPSHASDPRQVVADALAAHRDALVHAAAPDGTPAPWPGSLPLCDHQVVEGATVLDMVVVEDQRVVVMAWLDANHDGYAEAVIRLLSDPERLRRLMLFDLRRTDGVFAVVVPSETVDGEPVALGEVKLYAPHHCVVRESATAELVACDDAFVRMFGRSGEELIGSGRTDNEFCHPDDRHIAIEAWLEMLEKGRSQPRRWRIRHADDTYRWVEIFYVRDTNERGEMEAIVDITDVTEEMTAREELEARELLLNRVAQVVPVGLFEVDRDGRVVYANECLHRMLGTAPTESLEEQLVTVDERDRQWVLAAIERVAATGADEDVEAEVRHPATNEPRRCVLAVRALTTATGVITAVIVCVSDVTEMARRLLQLERDLIHRSFHDELTGLPNRALLINGMEEAIVGSRESGDVVAILLIDVDGFKAVNDTLGHTLGDELLRVMSDRLRAVTRASDLVARVGGDEFAVLMGDFIDPEHPRRMADQILAALSQPCEVDGHLLQTGVSIGISTNVTAAGPEELLRDADLAMYRAKAAGRGRYELFEPAMHEALAARVQLETSLRRAVDEGELRVVYQPIHDLVTGEVTGAEALVRWQHPVHGVVSPADFIPLAEETGLIVPVGRQVLDEACVAAARWADEFGPSAPPITVNFSARQLDSVGIIDDVGHALELSGLDPVMLTVEITESLVMERSETSLELLDRLRNLGVALAIDDFGTGYSSLAYLEQLPVDIVKIDKAFVDRITEGGRHAKLISGVLALTRGLGLSIVAEGIETQEQLDALRALGCRRGQGYLFSRPIDPDAMRAYLATRPADRAWVAQPFPA